MFRLFQYITVTVLLVLTKVSFGNCQWNKLKGKWIDSAQHFIQISDTIGQRNSISNENFFDRDYFLRLIPDTLCFYSRYTSSKDNYSREHIDEYNFKILTLTDSFLTIIPVSELSRKIFKTSLPFRLTRREYFVDTTLDVEQIVFHSEGSAWGSKGLSIQVDSSRKILYSREFGNSFFPERKDSLSGNNKGILSKEVYNRLLSLVKTSNVQNLKYNESFCCDGSVMTLIIHSKGRRTYIKSMFFPYVMNELVDFFYHIDEKTKFEKTAEKFLFEM